MGAEDTVMNEKEIKNIILKGWCSPETRLSEIFPEPWDYAIAKAQAELSYKQGRGDMHKEIVEWLEDRLAKSRAMDIALEFTERFGYPFQVKGKGERIHSPVERVQILHK